MDGEQRREAILQLLMESTKPVSGGYLAKIYEVSRQVIVQDVALLRASGCDVLATARGYIYNEEKKPLFQRVVMVCHNKAQTEEELNVIVDNGGIVRNVIIMHPIYGELVGDLMLRTRREVREFMTKLEESNALPLLQLSEGTHMHTIESDCVATLDIIEEELAQRGLLSNID